MPTTATIVGVAATVGMGAASASGALNPDAPAGLNYGAMTRDAQQATIDLLPSRYAAQQQFDPKFASLNNQIAYQNLFGTPGGTKSVQTVVPVKGWRNSFTGEFTTTDPTVHRGTTGQLTSPFAGLGNVGFGNWVETTENRVTDADVTSPATLGLLDIAEQAQPRLTTLQTDAASATRAADVGDVGRLGPAALAALRGFNPQQTQLVDELTRQAQEGLDAGTSLLPQQRRTIEQNLRAAQAARGVATGPNSALQESQALSMEGEAMRNQRRQFASGVVQQQQGLYGDPFLQILGRPSGATLTPNAVSNTTPSTVGGSLAGIGTAPYSIGAQNQAYANNANIAGYNQQMSGLGTLAGANYKSLFGSLAGLFGSGAGSSGLLNTYGAGGMAY